ncbi:MAG: response regulator transcription factor [Cyclobacteriaceae bacterium]|nr:response regulator transcription factor [Cyclobacteriaceae bacterium]
MKKIKLAIADDHEKFRKAIIRTIQLEKDLEVIIEAENGADLLKQLKIKIPDIILMDIRMPIMNGIEATDEIKEHYPHLKVIAYSQYDLESNIIEMYAHGVKSFIGKEDELEELFKAIRTVSDGGAYMTSHSAQLIQNYLKDAPVKKECPYQLTELEKYLIKGISNGLTSIQLSEKIYKSHRTVEKYIAVLYKKFGVSSKVQLTKVSAEWNMKDW